MYTIIDADSILFKAAVTAKSNKDIRKNIKDIMLEIEGECFMGEPRVAVKGKGNYRYKVYPEYKSNRPPIAEDLKKKLNYAHQHMVEKYNAVQADGMEADDLCSIWCWECINNEESFILAHIDKDLNQIPGPHYNYNKKEHYHLEPEDAYRSLMMQWLTGDTSDGIPGIKGVGPKKAEKILEGVKTKDMEKVVRKAYADNGYPNGIATRDYKLLYMLQTWEEFNEYNEEENKQEEGVQESSSEEADDTPTSSKTPISECNVGMEGQEEVQVSGVSGVSERDTGHDTTT